MIRGYLVTKSCAVLNCSGDSTGENTLGRFMGDSAGIKHEVDSQEILQMPILMNTMQETPISVADPGFPRGGGANLKGGRQLIKMKKF